MEKSIETMYVTSDVENELLKSDEDKSAKKIDTVFKQVDKSNKSTSRKPKNKSSVPKSIQTRRSQHQQPTMNRNNISIFRFPKVYGEDVVNMAICVWKAILGNEMIYIL